MRRSGFARKAPERVKPVLVIPEVPPKPKARMAVIGGTVAAQFAKTPDRVNQAIRESARGEECLVRITGACTYDPATTIWSHAPLGAAGKGKSIKALDLCGAYCCTSCDAVIDGQRPLPEGQTRATVMLDWFMGHMRSLVRLRQKGLV